MQVMKAHTQKKKKYKVKHPSWNLSSKEKVWISKNIEKPCFGKLKDNKGRKITIISYCHV